MKNNKDKMNNFPFSEIIQTFLMELNFVNGKFKRKLHDLFILKKIGMASKGFNIAKRVIKVCRTYV